MSKNPLAALIFLIAYTTCTTASATYEDGLQQLKIKNYVAAMQEFKDADQFGDTRATYQIGKLYLNGLGVKKDTSKAGEYFEAVFKTYQAQLELLQNGAASNSVKIAELQSRIGEKVCRNGILTVVYQPMACYQGTCSYMNSRSKDVVNDGQILGNIEQMTKDGSRMQIRLMGWASNSLRLKKDTMNILEAPKFEDNIEAIKGSVIWDDTNKWFSCF